jgi:YjbE family integral membrane protein
VTEVDLFAFTRVTAIDVLLAGDNAIAVGAIAAGLPGPLRRRALVIGVAAALMLRIAFAMGLAQILAFPGVMVVGALLLFWIGVKMVTESVEDCEAQSASSSFGRAVWAIVVADVTLSLDNVLGVAAAAGGHQLALATGLLLSVVLMGSAAAVIARVIRSHPWIVWLGFIMIELLALKMLVDGVRQFSGHIG